MEGWVLPGGDAWDSEKTYTIIAMTAVVVVIVGLFSFHFDTTQSRSFQSTRGERESIWYGYLRSPGSAEDDDNDDDDGCLVWK